MKHEMSQQFSFAMLFDPAVARAAVERAAQWDLPRRECHPLDRYVAHRVSAELEAYDAAVELAPVLDDEVPEELSDASGKDGCNVGQDADFDDTDDL